MSNSIIRREAATAGYHLSEIAENLNISESRLIQLLRARLRRDTEEQMRRVIDEIMKGVN